MRRWGLVLLGLTLVLPMGCGKSKQPAPPPQIQAVPASEIPQLVKKLETGKLPGMAQSLTIRRLGEAGPAAKSAVPVLNKLRKTADDGTKKIIDEALAKIGG